MKRLVVATKNKGKTVEIKEMLKHLSFDVVTMEEIGINEDIEENGTTFEENALLKAKRLHELAGEMTMADDSGLEVDFLGGEPGIYSARFAGEGATDKEKIEKVLRLLKDVPYEQRTARFVCCIAIVYPQGNSVVLRGTCEGYIAFEPQGSNGFGYDPIFYLPQKQKTFAQITSEEKHSISHRGNALRQMVKILTK